VGIEFKGLKVDVNLHLALQSFNGNFQGFEANHAPRARYVRNKIDFDRSIHAPGLPQNRQRRVEEQDQRQRAAEITTILSAAIMHTHASGQRQRSVSAQDKSSCVARPDVVLADVNWRLDTEVSCVALALLDSLIETAHALIVADSLSPKSVVKVGDKLSNKPSNQRQ